jgi:predicted AAA+ superfamily ATPase
MAQVRPARSRTQAAVGWLRGISVRRADIQDSIIEPAIGRGVLETIACYLTLLEETFLIAALEKYSKQARRRRSSLPKLVALDNALITALHPDGPPDPKRAPRGFGAWVENACRAYAWNRGQRVAYWREEPLEVDGVLEGSRRAASRGRRGRGRRR